MIILYQVISVCVAITALMLLFAGIKKKKKKKEQEEIRGHYIVWIYLCLCFI